MENVNYYSGMSQAQALGKQNPKIEEAGDHIIAVREWTCSKSTNPAYPGKVFDAFEFEVVKTVRGNGNAVGMVRSRVRELPGKYSAGLSEVAERALVIAKIVHLDNGAADHASIVKGPELDQKVAKWVGDNGRPLAGLLLKITVGEKRTTAGGNQFSPVNYAIPTEADLVGIPGRDGYRLVGE